VSRIEELQAAIELEKTFIRKSNLRTFAIKELTKRDMKVTSKLINLVMKENKDDVFDVIETVEEIMKEEKEL